MKAVYKNYGIFLILFNTYVFLTFPIIRYVVHSIPRRIYNIEPKIFSFYYTYLKFILQNDD